MTEFFNFVLVNVAEFLGIGGIFLIVFLVDTGVFITCLVLSIKKIGYKFLRRLWTILIFSAMIVFQIALESYIKNGNSMWIFSLFLLLIYTGVIYSVRVRNYKSSKQQREALNKILDGESFNDDKTESTYKDDRKFYTLNQGETKEKAQEENPKNTENNILTKEKATDNKSYKLNDDNKKYDDPIIPPESIIKTAILNGEEKARQSEELDFTHVKNVIKRLEYYPLKDNDKRQVMSLEMALLKAEKGEFNEMVKESINDGLGALLKIMSKYGI